MQARNVLCVLTLVTIIVGLAGCGKSKSEIELVSVSGVIKLDGQPVKSGTINFVPNNGNNPTTGGTVVDGRYSVKVPPGPMKIAISAPKVIRQQKAYDTPDSPMIDITEEAIPAAYNSNTTLEHVVTTSKRDLNFDLKSAP